MCNMDSGEIYKAIKLLSQKQKGFKGPFCAFKKG